MLQIAFCTQLYNLQCRCYSCNDVGEMNRGFVLSITKSFTLGSAHTNICRLWSKILNVLDSNSCFRWQDCIAPRWKTLIWYQLQHGLYSPAFITVIYRVFYINCMNLYLPITSLHETMKRLHSGGVEMCHGVRGIYYQFLSCLWISVFSERISMGHLFNMAQDTATEGWFNIEMSSFVGDIPLTTASYPTKHSYISKTSFWSWIGPWLKKLYYTGLSGKPS